MSKYFAVRHKKIGFVISYLIPIAFVFLLWDSKKIRKGILTIVLIDLASIGTNIMGALTDFGLELFIISSALFVYVWWKYYSKCVSILESKNDLIVEK